MTTMDPIAKMTLALAIATFLLALAAGASIYLNYIFRREDRNLNHKLSMVDEIIEWVLRIRETLFSILLEITEFLSEYNRTLNNQIRNIEEQKKISERRSKALENLDDALKKMPDIQTRLQARRMITENDDFFLRDLERELRDLKQKELSKDYIYGKMWNMLSILEIKYDLFVEMASELGGEIEKVFPEIRNELDKASDSLKSNKKPDNLQECFNKLDQLYLECFKLKISLTKRGLISPFRFWTIGRAR